MTELDKQYEEYKARYLKSLKRLYIEALVVSIVISLILWRQNGGGVFAFVIGVICFWVFFFIATNGVDKQIIIKPDEDLDLVYDNIRSLPIDQNKASWIARYIFGIEALRIVREVSVVLLLLIFMLLLR